MQPALRVVDQVANIEVDEAMEPADELIEPPNTSSACPSDCTCQPSAFTPMPFAESLFGGLSEPRILVVLTNYRRPVNVAMTIGAIRSMPHRCKIVVVDNHPPDCKASQLPPAVAEEADDVWTMQDNYGPPCRFAPALLQDDCEYVWFQDEDILPHHGLLEAFLHAAEQLDGRFATLGTIGRRFERSKFRNPRITGRIAYQPHDVPLAPCLTMVDMTISAHFVRADMIHHAVAIRWAMRDHNPGLVESAGLHEMDDLALCLGIQRESKYPSYLLPEGFPPHRLLEEPSLSGIPGHVTKRTKFVRAAAEVGWESLIEKALARAESLPEAPPDTPPETPLEAAETEEPTTSN